MFSRGGRDVLTLVAFAFLLGWLAARHLPPRTIVRESAHKVSTQSDPYGIYDTVPRKAAPYVESIVRASLSSGGTKCIELFTLNKHFREQLINEARRLREGGEKVYGMHYRTRIFGFKSLRKDAKHQWPVPDKNHRSLIKSTCCHKESILRLRSLPMPYPASPSCTCCLYKATIRVPRSCASIWSGPFSRETAALSATTT